MSLKWNYNLLTRRSKQDKIFMMEVAENKDGYDMKVSQAESKSLAMRKNIPCYIQIEALLMFVKQDLQDSSFFSFFSTVSDILLLKLYIFPPNKLSCKELDTGPLDGQHVPDLVDLNPTIPGKAEPQKRGTRWLPGRNRQWLPDAWHNPGSLAPSDSANSCRFSQFSLLSGRSPHL